MSNPLLPILPPHSGSDKESSSAPVHGVLERTRPVAPSSVLPPILTSKPTLGGLLSAFRRCWRLATGIALVVAVVAASAAWYLTSPASYTVSTTLRVDSNSPRIFFVTQEGRQDFGTYQRSQMALIKQRMVLNSALRDPKVAQLAIIRQHPDPIDWLSKQIQVDFALSPELMRISMMGRDAEALTILVDAVREAYLREAVNKEQHLRLTRLDQLKKLNTEYEDWLRKKRKILRDLADDLGSKDDKVLAIKQEFAIKELSTMQQELLGLQSQIRRAKLDVALKEDKEKTVQTAVVPEALIEDAVRKDKGVITHEAEIAKLEKTLADIREHSTDPKTNPSYTRAETALEAARMELMIRRAELFPKLAKELREQRRLDVKRDQGEQEDKLTMLEKLDDLLSKQVRERSDQIHDFGKKTIDLDGLREEIDLIDHLSKKVATEVEALKVELQAPARVTPADETYAARRDSIALMAAAGTGFAGFGVVLFAITLLEFRARRLVDVEDLSHGLRLQVVGTMPRLSSRAGGPLPQSGNSRQAASQRLMIESVDAARTVILHASRRHALRVVMITSAVSGEGKTLLSAHLAASIARAGWRALLVDADFRRPSLHKIFGLDDQRGLSEVLRGEADILEVRQPGPIDGLWVLPAGHCDTRSMQALAQGALRSLFDRIKGDYDLIVVDSAPVLPVVDSQLIAQAVDGVILSVLRDVSRLPLIHSAYERLMLFQVSLLGAVVHGADVETYGSLYPYLPIPSAVDAAAPQDAEKPQ